MQPSRSAFARIARWCYTHRAATILGWIAAAIVITVIGSSVGTKEIANSRLPGTESQAAYDLLAAHSPAANGDSDQLVVRARTGTLHDPAAQKAIAATVEKLGRFPGVVAQVTSPVKRLSRDGRTGVGTILYTKSTNDLDKKDLEHVQDAALSQRSASLEVEQGGPGSEAARFASQQSSEGLSFVLAAVVLLLTFGTVVAAGMPLLTAAVALTSTLGLIKLLSHLVDTPDFATQLATLIGLGVGIDYSLFVLTRYRTEVKAGRERLEACVVALDTAGRTVFFAACTVIIALLGLLLLGLSFLQGVALGAALAVLLTMLAALTLLPALVGWAGRWVDRIRLPTGRAARARRREAAGRPPRIEGAGWARWSGWVQRHPWPAAVVSLVVLLGLAAPALDLRLGNSDAGVDPSGSTTRKAYDLIADAFGPGINGPFLVAVDVQHGGQAGAQAVARAIKADRGIQSVSTPQLSKDKALATISAVPRTGPQDAATGDTLDRLRDDVVPPVEARTGADVKIGGFTASNEDFSSVVSGKLPLFVGVVVLLSALLLLAVFRSVFIPVKAACMNLLSIGAALGVVTLVFQDGHGAGLIGVETGPIESFLPVLLFAIVFGLSMDYEVFLISRVHEEWEKSKDASDAVREGLATTGRVITAAASIMVLVFASFALGDDRIIKLFGIGLASAVFLDALIIRCLLVPALMELAGRRAWYLPGWLDRAVPSLNIERPTNEPVPEGT